MVAKLIVYENGRAYVSREPFGRRGAPTYIVFRAEGAGAVACGWISCDYPHAFQRAKAHADKQL